MPEPYRLNHPEIHRASYCPTELSLELAVHGKHTAASSNLAVTWTCGDPEIELIADVRTGSNVGLGAKEGSDLMQVSPVEQITHTLLFQTSTEHRRRCAVSVLF